MRSQYAFWMMSILFAGAMGCAESTPPGGATTPTSATATPTGASTATQAPLICKARIAREWHGKTTNAKAEEYAAYLGEAIKKFRTLKGNAGYQMMRETIGEETHFGVISYWESRDAIKAYAGEDIRRTRFLPRDPEFLVEPEPTVKNYDLTADIGCN